MKKFYFYGCSFTAGDELSDNEYPELQNHPDQTSYHQARLNFLKADRDRKIQYLNKNRSLAYPAKIAAHGFDCKNFAENGASLEEMIHKIIMHVSNGQRPDAIFLQIPPMFREAMYLNDYPYAATLRLKDANINIKLDKFNDYLLSKAQCFTDEHFAIHDIVKLYTLIDLLQVKNIKFYLLEMVNDLKIRFDYITNPEYNGIINEVKNIPSFDAHPFVMTTANAHCFAGHFSERMHQVIADQILKIIK